MECWKLEIDYIMFGNFTLFSLVTSLFPIFLFFLLLSVDYPGSKLYILYSFVSVSNYFLVFVVSFYSLPLFSDPMLKFLFHYHVSISVFSS